MIDWERCMEIQILLKQGMSLVVLTEPSGSPLEARMVEKWISFGCNSTYESHDEATRHIGELVFGNKTVAVKETARGKKPQAVDKNGGPGRTRTCDQGIMSPQL